MATKKTTTKKNNSGKKSTGAFVPVNLKDIEFVNKPIKTSKKK